MNHRVCIFACVILAAACSACRNEKASIAPANDSTSADQSPTASQLPSNVSRATEDETKVESSASKPEPPSSQAKAVPKSSVVAPVFETIGGSNGLRFRREDDICGKRRIFESTGGGVALFDFDLDGWLDVMFTGGCKLPLKAGPHTETCGLFKNLGSLSFSDATKRSRLLQPGYCQGVAVGDYDNDGFDDVYIAAFGENGLWHNNGDGTFEDVTQVAGVSERSWSTSCAFADLNLDGVLDLFVVNYLRESSESPLQCPNPNAPDGFEQCPPSKYQGVDDVLFVSDGQGSFINMTKQAGMSGLKGKGLGLVIGDLGGDSRPEIYVSNDGQANFLFRNTASSPAELAYEDCALLAGAALSRSGYAQASMGIAAGDYDENSTIDLIITNFYGDSNIVYQNRGQFTFEDVTRSTGLAGPSRSVLGWGTVLIDLNNDNKLDLFVANGHVEDRRWNPSGDPYQMPPQVFVNEGRGRFVDTSASAGEYFAQKWLGRGVAVGDLDRDGRCDLVVSQQLDPSTALVNRTPDLQPATTIRLIGTSSNRNAVGAKVELVSADGQVLAYRELTAGTSFQSTSSRNVLLNQPPLVTASLRVTWPTGKQELHSPVAGSDVVLIEGAVVP